ncbi:MAG: protein tyrosine phosphatase family protein [Cellvibrionaceae bacterium]
MSIEKAYNFRLINSRITTSGVISAEQLQELSHLDYQRVINLLPSDSEYAVADEQQLIESQNITYNAIPVDFSKPSPEDYQKFLQVMQQSLEEKIHIHCAANYRVSAFFSIYACQHLGWDSAQAKRHIESLWQPSDHSNWLRLLEEMIPGYCA